MRPLRAPLALALVWLVGAAAATSVGLLAVRLVAAQVGDPAVPAVRAAPSVPGPAVTTTPTAGARAEPSALLVSPSQPSATSAAPAQVAPTTRTFTSVGGRVGTQCRGGVVSLVLASPAIGYAVDEHGVRDGVLEVRFDSDGTRVRLELGCRAGQPVLLAEEVDEQRSGGDDG